MSRKSAPYSQAEDEAIAWLARLNSARFTLAEEKEFMHWLDASALNQAAYIKAENLWQRGAALARVEEPEEKPSWFQLLWAPQWALASVCLFAVAIGLVSYLNRDTAYSYQTAMGEQRSFQLQDGSQVTLNTNSQLDLKFNRKSRIASLTQGEVFFDVKRDSRPFDVVTHQGVVRVLGTHFSVYQSASDTLVTVIEGTVALGQLSSAADFQPAMVLQANQRLTMQQALAGQAPETLNASVALAWRKKQLVFQNQSLNQIVAELKRYYPETIDLASPELGERQITAVIQLTDLQGTLLTLAQSLNLEVEFSGSGNGKRVLLRTRQ